MANQQKSGPYKGKGAAEKSVVPTSVMGQGEVTPSKPSGAMADPTATGVVVEPTFIPPSEPTMVATPSGRTVWTGKTRSLSMYDQSFRVTGWAYDCKGYFVHGDPSAFLPLDLKTGHGVYTSWQKEARKVLVRENIQNAVLTELTNDQQFRYYLNAYQTLVADCGTVLNLYKLSMLDAALSEYTKYLPKYIGRIRKVWQRASALWVTPMVRAHALRNTAIIASTPKTALTIRIWRDDYLLPVAAGGPPLLATTSNVAFTDLVATDAGLGKFVAFLESLQHWMEDDVAVSAADMRCLKDTFGQVCTSKGLQGTLVQGLPMVNTLPGITRDASLTNDLLCRLLTGKDVVGGGTDIWEMYPVNGDNLGGGLAAIYGFGAPGPYDFYSIGAPKFGGFATAGNITDDVNAAAWCDGTDLPVDAVWYDGRSVGDDSFEEMFHADEFDYVHSSGIASEVNKAVSWGTASDVAEFMLSNHLITDHILFKALAVMKDGTGANAAYADALVPAADIDWVFYINPNDMLFDTAALLAKSVNMPQLVN